MNTDRNILFAVICLQIDLISCEQFVAALTQGSGSKSRSIGELLVELGWITEVDRSDVGRILDRRLQKHGDDLHRSLAASVDRGIHTTLTGINDADINASLASVNQDTDIPQRAVTHLLPVGQRYTRRKLHAQGGIGEVWLATDHQLGRCVALKSIRPDLSENARVVERFLSEAQITSQLEHPGIVPVYELVEDQGDKQPYYTMRFVNGRTLTEAAQEFHSDRDTLTNATDLTYLLNAFVAVCNAVAYAHSQGVLHRDLKGTNVMLGEFGEVIVLDWGLAKTVGLADSDERVMKSANHNPQLTMFGEAVGTPAYMAPEQATGRLDEIDVRTDVYGLGAVLYEVLTGEPPFTGGNAIEILRKVQNQQPTSPQEIWKDVPTVVESICLRALSKNRSNRPASAIEVARGIQNWQDSERRKALDALAFERDLFHALMDSTPDFIYFKDTESRFLRVNHAVARYLGVREPEEALGKTDADFFSDAHAAPAKNDEQQVLQTGKPVFRPAEREVWPDGRVTWVSTTKVPFRNRQGEIIGTLGISRRIPKPDEDPTPEETGESE